MSIVANGDVKKVVCDACGNELPVPTTRKRAEGWEVHGYNHGRELHQIHTCGCEKTTARVQRFIQEERDSRP